LSITATGTEFSYFWSPVHYAMRIGQPTIEEAIAAFRATFSDCVNAWASVQPRAFVALSGGVDSSLVAVSLAAAQSREKIIGVTYCHESTLIDESHFARLVAQQSGIELLEIHLKPKGLTLDFYHRLRILPFPLRCSYNADRRKRELSIAAQYGLTAAYYGNGGDGVLFRHLHNVTAQDYAIDNGIGSEFLRFSLLSARMCDTTIWSALWAGLKARLFKPTPTTIDPDDPLILWGINKNLVEKGIYRKNSFLPWEEERHKLLPGKNSQIDVIAATDIYFPFLEGEDFIETISPIMSQPVVELCLTLPSYILTYDGRDRGLARKAFEDLLPRPIRLRRFKSGGSPYYVDLFNNNRDFIEDFLLNGELSSRGFLDTDSIAAMVRSSSGGEEEHYVRLEQLCTVEAWVRAVNRSHLSLKLDDLTEEF